MTSNMARCFNRVLEGVRALPMTTTVQYTFDKINVCFLKYLMETDKQIACENKEKHKYNFPSKVEEWLEFESRKADSEDAVLYHDNDWMYEVRKSLEEAQTMATNTEAGLSRSP